MTSDATTAAARRDPRLHFPLQPDERVLELCRRHWLYLWPRMALMTLFALVPTVLMAVLVAKTAGLSGTPGLIFWIAALVWLAYWAVRLFLNWYRYHNDIWVITNQRIVDSTKTSPFRMKMSTADLVNIQDMTVERNGILRTMFDYGDIVCQTAADVQEFRLAGIPHPAEVQLLVDRERDLERGRSR